MDVGTRMAAKVGLPILEAIQESSFRSQNRFLEALFKTLDREPLVVEGSVSALKEEKYSHRVTNYPFKEEKHPQLGNDYAFKEEKHFKWINDYVIKKEKHSKGVNGSTLKEKYNTGWRNAPSSKIKFDIQKTLYTKTKGVANIKGQLFEIKMAALVFVRAINDETIMEFHLGNNVEGAAAYDDLLVKFKKVDDHEWKTCFVQLKHKVSSLIGLKTCTGKGDFSLKKYWQSYKQIKAVMEKHTKDFLFDGSFENCHMVLYTNAKLHPELAKRERYSKPNDIDALFNSDTGKQVIFNFNKDCDHEIFEQLVEDEGSTGEIEEFLSALRVFSGQPSESQLDDFIKKELLIATDMIKPDINIMYQTYIENISKWWSDGNTTLNHESDIIIRTSETCKVNIMSTREVKQHCFGITFTKDVVSYPDNLLKAPLSHIMCNEMSTKLSCTKLVQSLQLTQYGYIFLTWESLLKEMKAVMSAWNNKDTSILIIACGSEEKHEYLADLKSICDTLCERLQKYTCKHLIVVAHRDDTFTTKLKNLLWDYNDFEDDIHINQLEREWKNKIISKEILLQGKSVKLHELFKGMDDLPEGLFNDAFVEHILREDIWRLGPLLENPVSNYVPRTWLRNDDTASQPSMSRPKTTMDFASRIVLIVACPGMGKTTLLNQLAIDTKAAHPSLWVVKVDLIKHIDSLKSMSLEDGVDFLEAALGICSTSPSERTLFRHSIKVQGNAVVFLDGFDEIVPKYTEKGLQLLSSLMTTKVSKIFISTRHSMKAKLENHLSALSSSLLPFSENDQIEFLCKMLSRDKSSHQEIQVVKTTLQNILGNLKYSFPNLSEVLGIPLHSMMLSEILKDRINDCLIDKVDLLSLFNRFVNEKCEIHLSKMFPMHKNVDYEIERLRKRVIDDHTYAALASLLDDEQLKSLNKADKIIKRNELFCRQVEESRIKIGIVEKCLDNKAVFIHRLFAEYFVALYMSNNINENRTYLSSDEFKIVRRFLDLMPA